MKLNQVWNIFRKDIRHQWIEILVSLVLVVGFAWAEMNSWSERGLLAYGGAAILYGLMSGLAVNLLPVSWMFLILRAVHSESLAGDRQFWVTRPYDWKQLLAAKILFVIVFVNVPLFLAHLFLVYKAGFHPTHYFAGYLWLQLFWTLILLLPTAALATVTRNIGQMLLALLFVGLLAIGLSALADVVPNSGFSEPIASIDFRLVVIASIAVILLQYSLRRTGQSRWLLGGLAALLTLVLVAAPYRALIARSYPPARADFPLQLTVAGNVSGLHYDLRNRVPVPIALKLAGLPQDSFVELNGYTLTLRNASGRRWDSGWMNRGQMLYSDEKALSADVEISKEEIDRLSSAPMTGKLSLAFTLYHDRNPRPFIVPDGEFLFPDLGFCSTGPNTSFGSLSCRIALRRPRFLLITSEMAASTCPLAKDQIPPKPGEMVHAAVRGSDNPADIGLSPILMDRIGFWNNRTSGICPGTPLMLSDPETVGRNSIEVHIDSAWFDAYLKALNQTTSR
jgi:hypothetical protein